jgi:hypothetical protein
MSMLQVNAACPCCLSKVDVIAACPSCILLLLHSACPCNMYMLHTHAAYTCCIHKLHTHAVFPGYMSLLHSLLYVRAVCPCQFCMSCCMSLKRRPACPICMSLLNAHAACPCRISKSLNPFKGGLNIMHPPDPYPPYDSIKSAFRRRKHARQPRITLVNQGGRYKGLPWLLISMPLPRF